MRVTYDASIDAAYIYLADEIEPGAVRQTFPCEPEKVRGSVNLDFDAAGRLLGLEILNASVVLPGEVLRKAEVNPREAIGKR